jgi:serine/threonine protein kinase
MGACWSAIQSCFERRGYTEIGSNESVEIASTSKKQEQIVSQTEPISITSSSSASSTATAPRLISNPISPTKPMALPGANTTGSGGITSGRTVAGALSGDEFQRKYMLRREIGSGSTSKVFDCVRKKDNEIFACKVINKVEIETNFSGLLDQFNLEIKVLKMLNHPNIIKLVDAYETSDSVYMVLEKCYGGELFDHVVDKGTLNEEEASTIIRNITSAVRHMHSLDIIHRDLKPENLLLTSSGKDAEVKLIDFGLAKVMQDDVARSFLGTKGYLAPEMLKRDAYDKSVDMWALGVIAFVLLCGCLPFDDDAVRLTSESAARKKFTLRFPRWSSNLSNSAKDLLYNLLDVDPTMRFTAEQALSHPWMRGKTVQINNYLESPSLLGQNRKEMRKKEAAALTAAAQSLSPTSSSNMNSRLQSIKEESRSLKPPQQQQQQQQQQQSQGHGNGGSSGISNGMRNSANVQSKGAMGQRKYSF